MATLIICRGWPGSGKSTFAKHMFSGVLLLENDMYHMHDGQYDYNKHAMPDAIHWCAEMAKTALQHGMDVVVANTFTRCRYIEHYKQIAKENKANFVVYRCIGNFKNVHGLDISLVQNFKDSMEDYPGETIVQPSQFKI